MHITKETTFWVPYGRTAYEYVQCFTAVCYNIRNAKLKRFLRKTRLYHSTSFVSYFQICIAQVGYLIQCLNIVCALELFGFSIEHHVSACVCVFYTYIDIVTLYKISSIHFGSIWLTSTCVSKILGNFTKSKFRNQFITGKPTTNFGLDCIRS